MAKAKTRLDQLHDAGVDYSLPINAFAQKAMREFNSLRMAAGIKTRVCGAEYSDGAARLHLSHGNDHLSDLGCFFADFSNDVESLARHDSKLSCRLQLGVQSVQLSDDYILVNF